MTRKTKKSESRAIRDADRLFTKVKKAHCKGNTRDFNSYSRAWLNSFGARIQAVKAAADILESKGKDRPSDIQLTEIAGNLNAWKGTNEEVTVIFRLKSGDNEDYRPTCSFGIENRALQLLALKLLRACFVPQKNQFLAQGGTKVAIECVGAALDNGYSHVRELDVVNCFGGFDAEKLPGLLPLPKEVTEHCLASTHLNLVPGNFHDLLGPDPWSTKEVAEDHPFADDILAVWRGIPQGSSVSPLVAEMLLSCVVAQVPSGVVVSNYADNFLVLARDVNDADDAEIALRAAFKSHPAGPLKPSLCGNYGPNDKIEFLGWEVVQSSGGYVASPSMKNIKKFKNKFLQALEAVEDAKGVRRKKKELRRLLAYVCSWTSNFSLWHGAEAWKTKHLQKVENVAAKFKL